MAEVIRRYAIEIEEGGDPFVVVETQAGRIRLDVSSWDVQFHCIDPIEKLAREAVAKQIGASLSQPVDIREIGDKAPCMEEYEWSVPG